MKVFNYLSDIYDIGPVCLALGNFDGMHRGHRQLAEECVRIAKEKGLTPVLFSFRDHPANVISGQIRVRSISGLREKCRMAEELGFEYMINIRFTENIMRLSPENFLDNMLLRHMDVKACVCGFNYSFGAGASGSAQTLQELGAARGITVSVVPEYQMDGQTVSSTRIRHLIEDGDTAEAGRILGRPLRLYPQASIREGEWIYLVFDLSQLLPGPGEYPARLVRGSESYCIFAVSFPDKGQIAVKAQPETDIDIQEIQDIYIEFESARR